MYIPFLSLLNHPVFVVAAAAAGQCCVLAEDYQSAFYTASLDWFWPSLLLVGNSLLLIFLLVLFCMLHFLPEPVGEEEGEKLWTHVGREVVVHASIDTSSVDSIKLPNKNCLKPSPFIYI